MELEIEDDDLSSSWILVDHIDTCPTYLKQEQPILHPVKRPDITESNINSIFKTREYRDLIADQLSGAVQIPTVTYDGMGRVGEDERWDVFYEIESYLERAFPKIYESLDIEIINEHALLYTWPGSDPNLKPILFMAHTDVVPVPYSTLDRWTYPPFSGHYDGTYIWGRGSADDKSNLIAILLAIDALLKVHFNPIRTVIFAVGFDEEGGADVGQGARCLAERLLKDYGEDGIELILDEGVAGIQSYFGTEFALLATAEKGYLDVTVTIDTAGGHSSTPPDHTAIGYIASIIHTVESNLFHSRLTASNPTLHFLQTAATHAKAMPSKLRDAILDPEARETVVKYMDRSLDTRALVRTSTAVDVVSGGEKSNALPETATVLINHRIAVEESVKLVKDHYVRILSPLAQDWKFELQGFGTEESVELKERKFQGTITLSSHDDLEPSPISSTLSPQFSWLTGTLRGVFGKEAVAAPVLLTGNTDTKYYWKLSSEIYRMSPWRASLDPKGTNMHTVDERMPIEGMVEMVRFYHEFIRVVDEMR